MTLPRSQVRDSSAKLVAKLRQKVIVCSPFDMVTFKEMVINKGAQGFLKLPLELDGLKACLMENGLIDTAT